MTKVWTMTSLHRLFAAALLVPAGLLLGATSLSAEDLNPVFSALPQMTPAEMVEAEGKGSTVSFNATLNFDGAPTESLPDLGITSGDNFIGDNAFSGSGSSFTSIVQNTGSNVVIQNLLAVNMNMVETPQ